MTHFSTNILSMTLLGIVECGAIITLLIFPKIFSIDTTKQSGVHILWHIYCKHALTHLPLDKMAAISQMT